MANKNNEKLHTDIEQMACICPYISFMPKFLLLWLMKRICEVPTYKINLEAL